MRTQQRIRIGISILLMFLLGVIALAIRVQAQQPNLDEAIKAVVRIRGCNSAGCNVGLGSGVIIHPSGVILTANHVTLTDSRNPLSPRLEDFVIEVTENARQAPQARYRARLIAAKPESDLALLGIYWDELTNQPLDGATEVNLPTLESADANTIGFSDQLHILGYPLAGGTSINYTEAALGGFDENGTLLKVNASLNEGYSGGPTLVERNGHYEIAGVVIRRRADVSLIRSIDQLHTLTWEPSARRVWADNVQVTAQGNAADITIKVSANIHALDYVNGDGRLLAYVFDANTRQPWPAGDSNLDRSANGQLVLRQVFSATQMVDILPQQTLTLSLRQLNTQADRLVFRLLLWDMNETHILWQDDQWRHPELGANEVAIAPTPTSTAILLPTPIPPPTATDTPTVTPAPTPTVTETPLPTNTPTSSAIATPNIPTATSTFDLREGMTATAAVRTIEAILNNPPVPTVDMTVTVDISALSHCTVVSRSLNLRSGPGTNYPVIRILAKDTELVLQSLNQEGNWIEVQLKNGGQVGWVSAGSQYINCNVDIVSPEVIITPTPVPTVGMTATADISTLSHCTVVSRSLNLRSEPSTNYPVIRILTKGTELVLQSLKQEGNWIEVQLKNGGQIGWVSAGSQYINCNIDSATVRINPVDDAVYVRVPSGEFMMGSDTVRGNEKPVHRVYLDEFWIMRTEVTNAQYKKCVEASVCERPNNNTWDKPEQANYPVTHVDWQQASIYAQWVSGRLPTEAEWEKAACGTDGRAYPWGNDEPTELLLNYNDRIGHMTEVGIYPKGASPYGALDMAGNAWEWTADRYAADYYASAPVQNPQGPATGNYRVVRGGSWYETDFVVRCAYRNYDEPGYGDPDLGFRVVAPGS